MNRRGFLQTILAACVAPAIVRADSLMRVIPRETTILLPQERFMPHELVVLHQRGYWVSPGDFESVMREIQACSGNGSD